MKLIDSNFCVALGGFIPCVQKDHVLDLLVRYMWCRVVTNGLWMEQEVLLVNFDGIQLRCIEKLQWEPDIKKLLWDPDEDLW